MSEWANDTITALDSTDRTQSIATTPGFDFPGGYPFTPSALEPGPSFEEIKDTAKEYICAAGQYVPSQEDLIRIAQAAGSNVRGYVPNGVAAYLGVLYGHIFVSHLTPYAAPLQPTQEPTTASPIEESETTPTTGEAFVLINRGNLTETVETRGNHEVQHESVRGPCVRTDHETSSRLILICDSI
jgi:hypothetical protein